MSKLLTDFQQSVKINPCAFAFGNYYVTNKGTGVAYALDGSQFGVIERLLFRRALKKLKKARGMS